MMKKVGLIDNLVDIDRFRAYRFHEAGSEELMRATGGNTGNVAFVFGTRKLLDNPIQRMEWGWAPQLAQKNDALLVCCANQLGGHTDLSGWADRLEQFARPVTLLGLGAQADSCDEFPAIPEGTIRFLEVVKGLRANPNVPNIAVRGSFTARLLENLGHESTVIGCPSLFINAEAELGRKISSRKITDPHEVAVAGGNPWHPSSAFLERSLLEIAQGSRAYVMQHPESVVRLRRGGVAPFDQKTAGHFLQVFGHPDLESLSNWFRKNAWDFCDVPTWLTFLSRFEAVVGPRYHGVALGMQCGIAGCVFTIDSRTEELCTETAIKSIPVGQMQGKNLVDLLAIAEWSVDEGTQFDSNRRKKAVECEQFILANGLQPSEHLKKIINAVIS